MGSRVLRVSLALILTGAASAAFAQGGGGIGRAGTYPPQFGPNTPSHKELLELRKEGHERAQRATVIDASSDAGGPAGAAPKANLAKVAP